VTLRSLASAAGLTALLLAFPLGAQSPPAQITIDASQPLNHITPWIYGSCIEDVNHELYGGLYDQRIFGESFEEPPTSNPITGWTTFGGNWQVDGPVVRVAPGPGAKLVLNTPDFADGLIQADVRLNNETSDNAGILARVGNAATGADDFDGYEISLRAVAHTLLLGKHRHNWQPLKEVPAPVNPGEWHTLRVDLHGPRIRIYLDAETAPRIDFTDTDSPLLSGEMALRTWNSDASFRNVRVRTDGQLIEGAFPQDPVTSVSGMWDPIHTGSSPAAFLQDSVQPFNGAYSQQIEHGPGAGLAGIANRGLNRWGIAVRNGQTFDGRLYLRSKNLQGPVTVALQSADGSRTYATHALRGIGANWAKYPFSLKSNTDDANARFALWIDRPGTLWVDQMTLLNTSRDRFKGLPVRADIAAALVQEGVTFLRYGGSMVNSPGYRWKNMIGDPDRRPPYNGTWYPYSTNGFGIEEFVKFCEAAHIEPAVAINIEETPQDAADMVEYLNGAVSTPWGHRRAENGHPRPYGVRYFEIGNEEVLGGDDASAYSHYIDRFQVLHDAMTARDPGIQLVIAAWWRPDSSNVERGFKALNGKAACWDLHVSADDALSGREVDRQLTEMQSLFQKWAPGSSLKVVIFEENGGLHNLQRALGHATILNAVQRHGDFVVVDCPANCLQPWHENDNGWDQGQIFFTADHTWNMPPYYAQQMAAQNHLPLRVESSVEGAPDLDITATRSEDGKALAIDVVNVGPLPQNASISVSGFDRHKGDSQTWTLQGPINAVNPPDGPETTRTVRAAARTTSANFDYLFPPHSFTILRLQR